MLCILFVCVRKRRGGSRGRGRGIAKRRGPKPRQHLSQDTATADDTNAEGTSTDANVSFKQAMSPPQSPTRKKHVEYNEEIELSLPQLKSNVIPENSTLFSSKNKIRKCLFYLLVRIQSFIVLVLSRDEKSDYIFTDDTLDDIQWNLEAMLSNVIARKNTIKDKLNTFASMQFHRNEVANNSKPLIIVSLSTKENCIYEVLLSKY